MFSVNAIKRLEAKEAKERAEANAKRAKLSDIRLYLDIAYKAIDHASGEGLYSTSNPFVGIRMAVDQSKVKEVWTHLREHGYTVSARSAMISWK
jgi:hypothetical protein